VELRHLRYFVAVAEERSFVGAAARLQVAQPALSKQIRDLERELGVALFERLPRGVRLTPPGEAFLVEARNTLEQAGRAIASARGASGPATPPLRFAHGQVGAYDGDVGSLVARLRDANPHVSVDVRSMTDAEMPDALREGRIDVVTALVTQWPLAGFSARRLVDCSVNGVLLPASHPLAVKVAVRLEELRDVTWLHAAQQRWPGFFTTVETALNDRGLFPPRQLERAKHDSSGNVLVAAGEAWALANDVVAGPYANGSTGIVYRPFTDPPIPCWLALIWRPDDRASDDAVAAALGQSEPALTERRP
jgi:DNA-binding transcriptional LysR family regulator